MRKMMFVGLLLLVFLSTGCSKKVEAVPMEDPPLNAFELLYDGDDFLILIKSEIEAQNYTSVAYNFGPEGNTCMLGGYDMANYMVYYDGAYYDFMEANKLQIFGCGLLESLNIL